jgi:hypothetical protein
MTTTTASTITTSTISPVWKTGVKAAAIAAVATTAYAAVTHAAGVSFEIKGEAIPLLGFGQLTFVLSMVGVGIAKLCLRFATDVSRAFVTTTVGLTVLSLVPDALADATTGTRLALMGSHLIAAAIVIPALASRLSD